MIRDELNLKFQKFGIKYLQNKLEELDPVYYLKVDLNNHRRLIRALEVCISSKKPYSSFTGKKRNKNKKELFGMNKFAKNAEIMVEKEDDEKERVLEMSIDELELSVRSYNCLKRANIKMLLSY